MSDNKDTSNTSTGTSSQGIDELVRIVNNHLNPVSSPSPIVNSTNSPTRTYSPPLMGTSARAAKHRIDSDSGPVRIEGTDTYNQQLQQHYQNVRQILEDQQQQSQSSSVEPAPESRQSFSSKRDYFEQRFKTSQPTYDTPPRHPQVQNVITTTTTTTTTTDGTIPNIHDRTSSSSNESPSVDHVIEQAVELQKLSNINAPKHTSLTPLIIERTEQYQVFLDSANHEIRRTPSISRTSLVPVTKAGHATDLDQAQAQIEHLTDDHQAIQQLTRVLQEHNVATINEYKRLPSQTHQTPPSSSSPPPTGVLHDRTNLPITSEFSVIDALLNNPIGTANEKNNQVLNIRHNDIITNLQSTEYLNTLKQPTKPTKESKKKQKEKPTKTKKKLTTDTVEHAIVTPLVNAPGSLLSGETKQPITTTAIVSSEQTPLIDPKEKKKQDKENKKLTKTNSKQKSKSADYQVIDAIIGSPVTLRLPDSYLTKYKVSAPLSQSSSLQSTLPPPTTTPSTPVVSTTTTVTPLTTATTTIASPTTVTTTTAAATTTKSKDNKVPESEKNQTLYYLIQIVNELQLHHAAALLASTRTTPAKSTTTTITPPAKSITTTTTTKESKEPVITSKEPKPIVNETVHQQSLTEQQRPIIPSNQPEIRPQSEPIKPRIYYRYLDEHGRLLKISSVAPSELREEPAHQYLYRNTEPPHHYGRNITVEDERRHPLPQYEQHATWQGESKFPTTVTREDFELRDKRVPHIVEQPIPTTRTIPVSVEQERTSRTSQQPPPQRTYHYPSQNNVKLAWLPLSYQTEQQYIPSGTAGYDTDSTISERSATYRPYDYGPIDSHYRHSNRPIYNDYYYNYPPPPPPPPPPLLPYGGRGISPEYGSLSRNYIEVFRGGDFRDTKPSEIYSLPLNEHIRTSPIIPSNNRHSRYDQYQSERYGTLANRSNISSPQQSYYSNSLPHSRYQPNIPPSTVHTSAYFTHRSPYQHRTVQHSPNPDYASYIRQSKSFDYRPLRTKLQREYKITPNLLVDEWDYPQTSDNIKYSTSTTNRSGVSSPDDVFITNRTNKA